MVVLLFGLSWATYRSLGLLFDPSPLNGYFQFIDMVLLQTRLLESLTYYHANPPMLNLIAGIGLKLFGNNATWFYSSLFHFLGLLLAMSFMVLVRELSGNRILALLATGALVFSPDVVLYQNWLMYTFPAAALITVSAVCLLKAVRSGQVGWLYAFFVSLAFLVLTRSLFHIGWLVLVVFTGLWLLPDRRKQLIGAAIVPLLVCTLWYGKNLNHFGQFGASTWMGLGVSNITTMTVPAEKLQPYVADGTLSPMALRPRNDKNLFGDLGIAPVGIPVLDNVRTSSGVFNYNHHNILVLGPIYRDDGFKVMRLFPEHYLSGVARANLQFFSTNNQSPFFWPPAHDVFDGIRPVYDVFLYGAGFRSEKIVIPNMGDKNGYKAFSNPGYLLILFWLTSAVFCLREFLLGVTGRRQNRDYIVIGYIVSIMLYTYFLGTLIELSENYRYRFLTEPVFWVVVIVMLNRLWQRRPGRLPV